MDKNKINTKKRVNKSCEHIAEINISNGSTFLICTKCKTLIAKVGF